MLSERLMDAPPDPVHARRVAAIEARLQGEDEAEAPLLCALLRADRDVLLGRSRTVARLTDLVVRQQKEVSRSYVLMCVACEALFHAGRLAMLAHLLGNHARMARRPVIRIAPDVPGHGDVVVCRVDEDRSCELRLGPQLSVAPAAEAILRLLLGSMRLWRWYLADRACEPGEMPLSLGDVPGAAGLAFCANSKLDYLLPDPIYLVRNAYKQEKADTDATWTQWETRRPVAFWRGSTTGHRQGEDWRTLPRAKLCALAAEVGPDMIDAALTQIVQVNDAERAEIEQSGYMQPYVPPESFQGCKYQIDIDGNANSWPGLLLKLYSGSPVLKVASPGNFRQWYYRDLVPWVNYVPVREDLSDLVERIEWLREHDEQARAIGQRGRELAKSLDAADARRRAVLSLREAFRRARGLSDLRLAPDDGSLTPAMLPCGWSTLERDHVWALGTESILVVPSPVCDTDYECRLALRAFIDAQRPEQRLRVFIDGRAQGTYRLTGDDTVQFLLPSDLISRRSEISILLLHPDCGRPCQFGLSGDARELSIALAAVEFVRAS